MSKENAPQPDRQQPEKDQETIKAAQEVILELLSSSNPAEAVLRLIEYLKSLNLKVLPVLSTTPPEILSAAKEAGIELQIIPVAQQDHLMFQSLNAAINQSQVPDWYRTAKELLANQKKETRSNILEALKVRWFLILIILMGTAAGVGFHVGWGVKLPQVIDQVDFYMSVYGGIAATRSVWQISRAERWNKNARRKTRQPYFKAVQALTSEEEATDPVIQKITEKIKRLSTQSSTIDSFLEKLGLVKSNKKRKTKPSLLEQYQSAKGQAFDREKMIRQLEEKMIAQEFGSQLPSIAVVIPTYQTSEEEMRRLLQSIKNQAYPVTHAYVVYNDNPNDPLRKNVKQPEFMAFQQIVNQVNAEPGRNNCQIQLLAQPARGKREAMAMGFVTALGKTYLDDLKAKYPDVSEKELSTTIGNLDINELPELRHDFILNIDSDTEIQHPFSVLASLIQLKAHPDAGTTTGDVRVTNRDTNLLSEMTYQRYWRAFFVERAAQSLHGHVTCMSGPWVCMRSEALAEVFEEWYFQEFLGQRCTYGDDRHLSTLLLRNGWESLFCPDSAVLTDCPTDWKLFLRQQLRWNKSFNRENFILFDFLHELDKFTQMDVIYQQSFAFVMLAIMIQLLVKAIVLGVDQGVMTGIESLLPYSVAVLAYNELFFGVYGSLKNRDARFLYSPTYIGYHFGSLLWLKLYAFFKLTDTAWGTKGETPAIMVTEIETEKQRLIENLVEEIEPQLVELPPEDNQVSHSNSDQNGESF
ncbi:MAG: hypothetical protein COY81_04450 [Candidatus Pacebacteria bacterium CG_4_10_14_0_8_um_filter_43_12]|nr:MAG: hypothetical protein COU66_00290 [Candidatus Pacebacteria bacterium CG10_big_fil_rev_8_21_14_0_10_44_11]PIY79136.1 MAG: hypothetical protein COY81_04450 [Candidatus Pacebacteria bacterium CG_4_10_14_0_8_um_filter_43_12]